MKQYIIIEHTGQTWLRPTWADKNSNAQDDEDEDDDLVGAVMHYRVDREMLYIGSKPVGSIVNESDIKVLHQIRPLSVWMTIDDYDENYDYSDGGFNDVRTVYTDIEPDYPGVDYQPLFNHMSKVHGLTLTTGEMDEIIGLSTYILSKK